jgi:hypothetical protein
MLSWHTDDGVCDAPSVDQHHGMEVEFTPDRGYGAGSLGERER